MSGFVSVALPSGAFSVPHVKRFSRSCRTSFCAIVNMRPDVARQALIATHGGLSLEWCATMCHILPMALYRLICALGQHRLLSVLLKCYLPLPAYILADEKHSKCLTKWVYLSTIVNGQVIWHLGYKYPCINNLICYHVSTGYRTS